jgi:hypothetical protein
MAILAITCAGKLVTNSSPKLVENGRFGDDFSAEKQGK